MDTIDNPSPRRFVLRRMSDYEVIQSFFETDIEEVIDIFKIKTLINYHFKDRARKILEYLYGYSDIIIDLDTDRACVMNLPDSAEEIASYLREEVYTLKYLREGDIVYDPILKVLTAKNNGRVNL